MTQPLEFEGKNVEQAIENACKELNITKEKLKYDVLSYGSTGIFGLVGTKTLLDQITQDHHKRKACESIPASALVGDR